MIIFGQLRQANQSAIVKSPQRTSDHCFLASFFTYRWRPNYVYCFFQLLTNVFYVYPLPNPTIVFYDTIDNFLPSFFNSLFGNCCISTFDSIFLSLFFDDRHSHTVDHCQSLSVNLESLFFSTIFYWPLMMNFSFTIFANN